MKRPFGGSKMRLWLPKKTITRPAARSVQEGILGKNQEPRGNSWLVRRSITEGQKDVIDIPHGSSFAPEIPLEKESQRRPKDMLVGSPCRDRPQSSPFDSNAVPANVKTTRASFHSLGSLAKPRVVPRASTSDDVMPALARNQDIPETFTYSSNNDRHDEAAMSAADVAISQGEVVLLACSGPRAPLTTVTGTEHLQEIKEIAPGLGLHSLLEQVALGHDRTSVQCTEVLHGVLTKHHAEHPRHDGTSAQRAELGTAGERDFGGRDSSSVFSWEGSHGPQLAPCNSQVTAAHLLSTLEDAAGKLPVREGSTVPHTWDTSHAVAPIHAVLAPMQHHLSIEKSPGLPKEPQAFSMDSSPEERLTSSGRWTEEMNTIPNPPIAHSETPNDSESVAELNQSSDLMEDIQVHPRDDASRGCTLVTSRDEGVTAGQGPLPETWAVCRAHEPMSLEDGTRILQRIKMAQAAAAQEKQTRVEKSLDALPGERGYLYIKSWKRKCFPQVLCGMGAIPRTLSLEQDKRTVSDKDVLSLGKPLGALGEGNHGGEEDSADHWRRNGEEEAREDGQDGDVACLAWLHGQETCSNEEDASYDDDDIEFRCELAEGSGSPSWFPRKLSW